MLVEVWVSLLPNPIDHLLAHLFATVCLKIWGGVFWMLHQGKPHKARKGPDFPRSLPFSNTRLEVSKRRRAPLDVIRHFCTLVEKVALNRWEKVASKLAFCRPHKPCNLALVRSEITKTRKAVIDFEQASKTVATKPHPTT